MATYVGYARSNYVLVKDVERFKEAMKPYQVEVEDDVDQFGNRNGRVTLLSNAENGWDWVRYPEDDGGITEDFDDEETDPTDLIGPHLQDGEVIVLMETGHEKLRYLVGWAIAFNNAGEKVEVSLNEIYDMAKELAGPDTVITGAEY